MWLLRACCERTGEMHIFEVKKIIFLQDLEQDLFLYENDRKYEIIDIPPATNAPSRPQIYALVDVM